MLNVQQHKIYTSPKLVVLFGSQASGKNRPGSDFDVGILADRELNLDDKLELMSMVARQYNLPEDKVDLVDMRRASPLLQMQISKEGKVLAGSAQDWRKFQASAMKQYEHTRKFRKFREQFLKQKYE